MTKNKPVWLLDVDGVLNACSVGAVAPKKSWPHETWKLVQGKALGQEWPIRYSTAMIDRINELSERCEIRWHTTWQFDAPALGEQLGLKPFEVAWDRALHARQRTYMEPPEFFWWKMFHAVDVINIEQRPLIWTDDDLFKSEVSTFKNALHVEGHYVLVSPNTNIGLTPKELDKIEKFISWSEKGFQKGSLSSL